MDKAAANREAGTGLICVTLPSEQLASFLIYTDLQGERPYI